MVEEVTKQEVKQEEVTTPDLASTLSSYPGAPDKEQLELWKQMHGEIFCSGFSETELCIWRPLTRVEYVALQKQLRSAPNPGKEPLNEFDYEGMVVSTCLLWSSVKQLERKGGSISTLSEQILFNSNFMPPQMAQAVVVRL